MSTYSSTFTGHAPGAFHLSYPDRFLDVAYNVFDPNDIRLTIAACGTKIQPHINTLEAREFALRLLIAIDTPHHIVKELLDIQDTAGTALENHF